MSFTNILKTISLDVLIKLNSIFYIKILQDYVIELLSFFYTVVSLLIIIIIIK